MTLPIYRYDKTDTVILLSLDKLEKGYKLKLKR